MNAIITGGTKGIGKAIVLAFVRKGINIAVCSRNQDDLEKLSDEIRPLNPSVEIITYVADVSEKSQIMQFVETIKKQWSRVDILVNNAGIFLPGSIIDEPDGHFEAQFSTNMSSAYHLTRAILPLMLPYENGYIFNMCSIASKKAYSNGGSYSISKFALYGFSQNLREELKPKGIKVSSILPGATWSNSWAGVDLPEERLMQANDIAIAVMSALEMSSSAVIEDIVIRPQLGDL